MHRRTTQTATFHLKSSPPMLGSVRSDESAESTPQRAVSLAGERLFFLRQPQQSPNGPYPDRFEDSSQRGSQAKIGRLSPSSTEGQNSAAPGLSLELMLLINKLLHNSRNFTVVLSANPVALQLLASLLAFTKIELGIGRIDNGLFLLFDSAPGTNLRQGPERRWGLPSPRRKSPSRLSSDIRRKQVRQAGQPAPLHPTRRTNKRASVQGR